MKVKKIMLITLLLFAVLTIGCVSAADDIASDNITVSDDADIIENADISDYDDEDCGIEVYDEICLDENNEEDYDEEAEIADITLPRTVTNGSFQILKNEEILVNSEINLDDEDHWYDDEDEGYLFGYILLNDLDLKKINDGDVLTLKFFEINDGVSTLIDSLTIKCTVSLTQTYLSLNEIEEDMEEDKNVTVDYRELEIIMSSDWNETEVVDFKIKKNIEGTIAIYLNDNKKPAFEKNIKDMISNPDEDYGTFIHYIVNIGDLNITEAGSYELYVYINDELDDENDIETLIVYEQQIAENKNATIEAFPTTNIINGDEALITINTTHTENNVVIYVDANETPIIIPLSSLDYDDGLYLIYSNQLTKEIGKHKLNITYMGANLIATVNLISKLVIELPEADETIYTNLNDIFVYISLEDDDIYENIEGKINLTILDKDGNTIESWVKNITKLTYDDESYVISTDKINAELNGIYTVVVEYFDGNESATKSESKVTFKPFDSKDYGASIKDIVKNENDYAVTFTNIPLTDDIIVKLDENAPIEIESSDLEDCFDSKNKVYYIKYNELGSLADGIHSISVYINNEVIGKKDLVSGNIIVDLEENIDPNLTVSVANIEEGNAAKIVITTNNTFSGNVIVQVANTNYTVNVTKGQGNISIAGLKANTYTATAFFKTNGILADSTKTATFKVTSNVVPPVKTVIKLTLKKVKVKKSAKKLVLKATLKINGKAPKKGTKIIFTFKGKKYTGKTNKNGLAKVTIKKKVLKKLKVGKKVKYTAKYSTKTVKRTVKVKK